MFTMYATYTVEENENFLKMDWSHSHLMTWCYLICSIYKTGWRQRKMWCVPFILFFLKINFINVTYSIYYSGEVY